MVGETGAAEAMAQLEEKGISPGFMTVVYLIQSLTYAPIINTFVSLGEEVGWRGAMLPRLKERFGRRAGWLLGGLIWGAWHWPVMILGGYEYGLAYWGAPVLGPLLFCFITTALGILFSLLYEKVGSIWICALAHGAFNAFANIPSLFLVPDSGFQQTLGPYAVGVIGGLPLLLLALFALLKKAPASRDASE
jgi:membrane protease YdiL (CAAX protease family)